MPANSHAIKVKIPMMPKGVEHSCYPSAQRSNSTVKIPMMPKGVEHNLSTTSMIGIAKSEDSNDAERR